VHLSRLFNLDKVLVLSLGYMAIATYQTH